MPNHEFVAYIDESGDDGLHKFREVGAGGGSSHWLILGCCIVRNVNDLSLVSQRDAILAHLKRTKSREIHFSKLDHAQKTVVVDHMAHMPIRLMHVLCCKKHIPDPRIYNHKAQLYWYLCRTLIERISWFCVANKSTGFPLAKIVFSTRGGLKYNDFKNYLINLQNIETEINWSAISPDKVEAQVHGKLAGLQFADATAGAFAAAVEQNIYGNYEQAYAKTLRPVVYRRKGNFLSYGVKFRCNENDLDESQKGLLEFYGKKSSRPPDHGSHAHLGAATRRVTMIFIRRTPALCLIRHAKMAKVQSGVRATT